MILVIELRLHERRRSPVIIWLCQWFSSICFDEISQNFHNFHKLTDQTSVRYTFERASKKGVFFCKKENSALSEHTCLTSHAIGWDRSKIITTNGRYHHCLCLEAWHTNSAHTHLNRSLLPGAHLLLVRKKRS